VVTRDFTITFLVDQTPKEAFDAINNVRAWWTEELAGNSQKLNDEFTVRFFDDIQVTTQLIEVIPDKKVVWLVTKSELNFIKNKNEWKGTKICFEIAAKDSNRTQIHFTHLGLVPESECYQDCFVGWNRYIKGSLLKLITSGRGKPELKTIQSI
jgi:hypothetical protein